MYWWKKSTLSRLLYSKYEYLVNLSKPTVSVFQNKIREFQILLAHLTYTIYKFIVPCEETW